MKKYNLENDIKVFGVEVKSFPEGIGDAFDKMANMISGGFDRSYYGLSRMTGKGIIYKAAAEEKFEGEAEKYDCERYIIEKGEYLMKTLKDWRLKTDLIKDIFHELMTDTGVDQNSECIEWYKDDNEMLCMIKTAGTKNSAVI